MTGRGLRDPAQDLRDIAFALERALEPAFRVRAFRAAAALVDSMDRAHLQARADAGTLLELPGVGKVTALVISESLSGEEPNYLRRVTSLEPIAVSQGAAQLRATLQGDCHVHSDWSDGGASIQEMALAAHGLGHGWMVLTDHSPRLKVARGLSAERLRTQLEVIAALNEQVAPFRILTGIECDINEDGSLDQDPALLAELDLVVGSVHSKLRMPTEQMTARMVAAISNPHLDVLGHCTGRKVLGERHRPESDFDADLVFTACAQFDVAVEVNSRPERLDPPKRLLRLALEAGCRIAINTDAHAPGQLDWQLQGCERAYLTGITADRVINAASAEQLLAWVASRPG